MIMEFMHDSFDVKCIFDPWNDVKPVWMSFDDEHAFIHSILIIRAQTTHGQFFRVLRNSETDKRFSALESCIISPETCRDTCTPALGLAEPVVFARFLSLLGLSVVKEGHSRWREGFYGEYFVSLFGNWRETKRLYPQQKLPLK